MNDEPITVLETWDPALVAVVKSLLDSARIRYIVKNEILQYSMEGGGILAGMMEIQVRPEDTEAATQLLQYLVNPE